MFERFTERARQVVVLAQDEARALKHNYIGTEHILLGLLREEEGLAARILQALDITVEEVRAQVIRIVGQGEVAVTDQIPFTPRARKVLEFALREALSLSHNYIDTEHILLGLTRENESVAVRVLTAFAADAATIREETIRVIRGPGGPQTDKGFPPGQDSGFELGLRRVAPIGQQMSDGTWIVSAEVWGHGLVLRYATAQRPYRPPLGGMEWHDWRISDDVGTAYARVGAGGGGSPQRGYYGDANFEPAPPLTATILHIRHEGAEEVVSVALTD